MSATRVPLTPLADGLSNSICSLFDDKGVYNAGHRFTVKQRTTTSPVGPERAKKSAAPGSIGVSSNGPTRSNAARFPNRRVAVTSLGERIAFLEKPGIIRMAIPHRSRVINPAAKLCRIASMVIGSVWKRNKAIASMTRSSAPSDPHR